MLRLFLFALIALAAPSAASAQPREAAAGIWQRSGERSTFVAAGISLPNDAGSLRIEQLQELSHPGQGLDNVAQYHSRDRQLFATIYIYAPTLPHAGLSAFMTDDTLRAVIGAGFQSGEARLASVGGLEQAAIRADYPRYREGLSSSAAFMKLDRWIVKVRVSGPEGRREQVEQAMTALLAGITIPSGQTWHTPEPLTVGACPDSPRSRATPLPSTTEDDLAEAMLGTVESEEHAREADGPSLLTPRFGSAWCLSSRSRIGRSSFPILRSLMPQTPPRDRSVMIVLLSDSGALLEVVETHRRGRYVLFHHQIGRTQMLTAFDGIPTDQQLSDLISGADRANARVRATIDRNSAGNTRISVTAPVEVPASPTT